ncbi:TolC family protein [Jiulongibacter sediminis]|uniref:Transporter n=1 Tax=Jiulongibacter sediminis TaxID=1605367 RepID=A0A0P7BSA3_9BACT|nr:TolC family protein [Jiulongibacter sediminis]KPM47322.1 hypothetical protein AFM12_16165 [Jiulongibacter sediminis]TBX22879.1 hypothetical protein TK44_16175 [Jiulongibacter sediminis]
MKKILKLALLTLGLQPVFAQQLSLKECVEIAVNNHPDYQSSVLNAELAGTDLDAAKSRRLPRMSLELYQSTNTGRSIDRFTNSYINEVYNSTYTQASLSQPIFQGFRIKNGIEASQLALKSSEEQAKAMQNDLTVRIIQAYLTVLQSQELVAVANSQVASSREQENRVKLQVEAGTLGQKELLQIQTQRANDEYTLVNAKGSERQSRLNLFQLLNRPVDETASFERIDAPELVVAQYGVAKEEIYERLPEIRSSEFLIKSFDSQYKSIKAENLPSLNFYADWNTFYASSNPEQKFFEQINATRNGSFTLGLQIPIFGKFQTSPRMQAAQVQKRIAQNQLRNAKLAVNRVYESALQNYEIAGEQYQNTQNQVAINSRNMQAVQAQIEAGTVNTLEYILAKTNLDRANSNLVQAKYQFLLQEKILKFYESGEWELN